MNALRKAWFLIVWQVTAIASYAQESPQISILREDQDTPTSVEDGPILQSISSRNTEYQLSFQVLSDGQLPEADSESDFRLLLIDNSGDRPLNLFTVEHPSPNSFVVNFRSEGRFRIQALDIWLVGKDGSDIPTTFKRKIFTLGFGISFQIPPYNPPPYYPPGGTGGSSGTDPQVSLPQDPRPYIPTAPAPFPIEVILSQDSIPEEGGASTLSASIEANIGDIGFTTFEHGAVSYQTFTPSSEEQKAYKDIDFEETSGEFRSPGSELSITTIDNNKLDGERVFAISFTISFLDSELPENEGKRPSVIYVATVQKLVSIIDDEPPAPRQEFSLSEDRFVFSWDSATAIQPEQRFTLRELSREVDFELTPESHSGFGESALLQDLPFAVWPGYYQTGSRRRTQYLEFMLIDHTADGRELLYPPVKLTLPQSGNHRFADFEDFANSTRNVSFHGLRTNDTEEENFTYATSPDGATLRPGIIDDPEGGVTAWIEMDGLITAGRPFAVECKANLLDSTTGTEPTNASDFAIMVGDVANGNYWHFYFCKATELSALWQVTNFRRAEQPSWEFGILPEQPAFKDERAYLQFQWRPTSEGKGFFIMRFGDENDSWITSPELPFSGDGEVAFGSVNDPIRVDSLSVVSPVEAQPEMLLTEQYRLPTIGDSFETMNVIDLHQLPFAPLFVGPEGDLQSEQLFSSNSSILEVVNGVLFPRAPGTVELTAVIGGKTVSRTVEIIPPPEESEFSEWLSIHRQDERTLELDAETRPETGYLLEYTRDLNTWSPYRDGIRRGQDFLSGRREVNTSYNAHRFFRLRPITHVPAEQWNLISFPLSPTQDHGITELAYDQASGRWLAAFAQKIDSAEDHLELRTLYMGRLDGGCSALIDFHPVEEAGYVGARELLFNSGVQFEKNSNGPNGFTFRVDGSGYSNGSLPEHSAILKLERAALTMGKSEQLPFLLNSALYEPVRSLLTALLTREHRKSYYGARRLETGLTESESISRQAHQSTSSTSYLDTLITVCPTNDDLTADLVQHSIDIAASSDQLLQLLQAASESDDFPTLDTVSKLVNIVVVLTKQ